jgi:hypothetical protein
MRGEIVDEEKSIDLKKRRRGRRGEEYMGEKRRGEMVGMGDQRGRGEEYKGGRGEEKSIVYNNNNII